MIDFRYFLVTIASIFLALAVGVALGSGPLTGSEDTAAEARAERLQKQRDELRAIVQRARATAVDRDRFLAAAAPDLLDGRLAGRQVVLVALPGANAKTVEQLGEVLPLAGAEVTGTVQLTKKWTDPRERQFLEDLSVRLVTADVQLPANGSVYDRAGALLARALVAAPDAGNSGESDAASEPGTQSGKSDKKPDTKPTQTGEQPRTADESEKTEKPEESAPVELDGPARTILSAYGEAGFVAADPLNGDGAARADLAVLIAPETDKPDKSDKSGKVASGSSREESEEPKVEKSARDIDEAAISREQRAPWLAIARGLDAASAGVVLAGDLRADGTPNRLVAALRSDANTRTEVSTVGAVARPEGRIVAALALAEQATGEAGHYGVAKSADGALPELATP